MRTTFNDNFVEKVYQFLKEQVIIVNKGSRLAIEIETAEYTYLF